MKYWLALSRIALGSIFFWAFLDKLFGLGMATTREQSWLSGASPTLGFLNFGTSGPFKEIFQNLADQPLIDWLFMLGLGFVGLALLLGLALRLAAYLGSLMMLLIYLAVLPKEHHPFIDEHIIYILLLNILPLADAGNFIGLGKWWAKTKLVSKYPILK
ncbi:MAG: DoxX family membrane protein [Patescibacteria group bacterium]|nr:DoxX family membrane protein [Patescibacteria group bacterium]